MRSVKTVAKTLLYLCPLLVGAYYTNAVAQGEVSIIEQHPRDVVSLMGMGIIILGAAVASLIVWILLDKLNGIKENRTADVEKVKSLENKMDSNVSDLSVSMRGMEERIHAHIRSMENSFRAQSGQLGLRVSAVEGDIKSIKSQIYAHLGVNAQMNNQTKPPGVIDE